jgi:hypothetical protein
LVEKVFQNPIDIKIEKKIDKTYENHPYVICQKNSKFSLISPRKFSSTLSNAHLSKAPIKTICKANQFFHLKAPILQQFP